LRGIFFGDTKRRSAFAIKTTIIKAISGNEKPVPHKGYSLDCFGVGTKFEVTFLLTETGSKKISLQELSALFQLVSILGGVGKRVRRGMGSFKIVQLINKSSDNIITTMPKNNSEILSLLNIISPKQFGLRDNKIVSVFKNLEGYPYIKQIEIGRRDSRILNKISNTTHNMHEQHGKIYEASLGHTSRGRFASPIFVSVIEKDIPIITTLNTAPKQDKHKVSSSVQEKFKTTIL
jgi:CRISPR-associated protein Cmr1